MSVLDLNDLYLCDGLGVRRAGLEHLDLLVDVGRVDPLGARHALGLLLRVRRQEGAEGAATTRTVNPNISTLANLGIDLKEMTSKVKADLGIDLKEMTSKVKADREIDLKEMTSEVHY